jgi:hypothetical protein
MRKIGEIGQRDLPPKSKGAEGLQSTIFSQQLMQDFPVKRIVIATPVEIQRMKTCEHGGKRAWLTVYPLAGRLMDSQNEHAHDDAIYRFLPCIGANLISQRHQG